jgi:hypothetical protein
VQGNVVPIGPMPIPVPIHPVVGMRRNARNDPRAPPVLTTCGTALRADTGRYERIRAQRRCKVSLCGILKAESTLPVQVTVVCGLELLEFSYHARRHRARRYHARQVPQATRNHA